MRFAKGQFDIVIAALFLSILSVVMGCQKTVDCDAMTLPDPVLLKVTDSAKKANLSIAEMYYIENGVKHGENDNSDHLDHRPFGLEYLATGYDSVTRLRTIDSLNPVLRSISVVLMTGSKGTRTFYISYGPSLIDSFTVTVSKYSHSCGHNYTLNTIQQNGIDVKIDSSYDPKAVVYPVYLLK